MFVKLDCFWQLVIHVTVLGSTIFPILFALTQPTALEMCGKWNIRMTEPRTKHPAIAPTLSSRLSSHGLSQAVRFLCRKWLYTAILLPLPTIWSGFRWFPGQLTLLWWAWSLDPISTRQGSRRAEAARAGFAQYDFVVSRKLGCMSGYGPFRRMFKVCRKNKKKTFWKSGGLVFAIFDDDFWTASIIVSRSK